MRADHAAFWALAGGLLLAPKIPLGAAGLPAKSGVSPAAGILLLWGLLAPRPLAWRWPGRYRLAVGGLGLFALYACVVSATASSVVAVLYAVQYALYAVLGGALLWTYVAESAQRDGLEAPVEAFAAIGLVFVLGIIVSVWTGPFYEWQTLWTQRRWDGLRLQQGVGFADGVNNAAATLLVLVAFYLHLHPEYSRWWFLWGFLTLVALATTLSRSGLASFLVGSVSLLALGLLRAALSLKVRPTALWAIGSRAGLVLLAVLAVVIALRSFGGAPVLTAVQHGVGVGETRIVEADMDLRQGFWREALVTWSGAGPARMLFGEGFRMTARFDERAQAWLTAHNLYLALLGDFGLIGLCLFVAPLLFALLKVGSRIVRRGGTGAEHALWVALVALLLHDMTETFLYSPGLLLLIILLLALAEQASAACEARGRAAADARA